MSYKICDIVEKTGISEFNLRNWEKRYGFPNPTKKISGHREYSESDLKALAAISKKLEDGSKAKELKDFFYSIKLNHDTQSKKQEVNPSNYKVELILDHLYEYNAYEASKLLSTATVTMSPIQALEYFYAPALMQIGNDWHAQKISVTQEHYSSQYIRNKLFSFLDLQISFKGQCKIAFATTSGERHEGGILLIAAGLALNGIRSHYFGNDIPLDDLLKETKNLNIKYLGLSYLKTSIFLRDIKILNKTRQKIILGGPGVLPEMIESKNIIHANSDLSKVLHSINKIL